MVKSFTDAIGQVIKVAAAGALALSTLAITTHSADAQNWSSSTKSQEGRDNGQYIPSIWVDPDGCEHWVMDDGVEGYMTPHVNRQGIPVCMQLESCAVMNSDQLFATNSAHVSRHGKARLAKFFQEAGATSYIITGHTDSRASDAYNMRLSYNRATSVAKVARSAGANIADVRGYGERSPIASNKTAHGMAKNRRVEIICIK